MAEIKNINGVQIILDYSLNVPIGHVFVNGSWISGPIQDISATIDIGTYKDEISARYAAANPVITEDPSANS